MKKIYIVGMGAGCEEQMTAQAVNALNESDVIVGYTLYLELLPERYKEKETVSTPMRREEERCRIAFEEASKGKIVSVVCSGDAGIYGMASLMFEIGREYQDVSLEVVPGITAACSGAAVLGAPLSNDFCTISLSDLLTPWDKIEKRLKAAAEGDFSIAIYNPGSRTRRDHLKRACDILLTVIEGERPCGYVENIGRENMKMTICTLRELRDTEVNMFTTVFVGNSSAEFIDGRLVTKRGYSAERANSKRISCAEE